MSENYKTVDELVEEYKKIDNIYREIKEDGFYTEKSLKEELEEIFEIQNVESDINITQVFDSPGLDIFVIFIAWIEEEKLKTYFNIIYRT